MRKSSCISTIAANLGRTATIILGTGMRPGEAYRLRWEFVLLSGSSGLIQVSEGNSKAARRLLPMIPEVYRVLKARYESQGGPAEGWVFPSTGRTLGTGYGENTALSAIAKANAETIKANADRQAQGPKALPLPLRAFEPYVMRHTALTCMAPFCDPFTLARIAGHSSITITQRAIPRPMLWRLPAQNLGIAENWSPRLVTNENCFPKVVNPRLR